MDAQRFEDLCRVLARSTTRRQTLKGMLAGVFGAVAASVAPGAVAAGDDGNAACATFCHQAFAGAAAGHCTAEAAQGRGPCYDCGPAAPPNNQKVLCKGACVSTACTGGQVFDPKACVCSCPAGTTLCNGKCVNVQADVGNCGACGKACTAVANAAATCTNGKCGFTCNAGYTLCNGSCVATASFQGDPKNCGACGTVCSAPANATATCTGGTCGISCNTGYAPCKGVCVATASFQSDANNCGACGTVCASGLCAGGVCQPSPVGGHCVTNTDCANASLCVGGICQPEPPGKPCTKPGDCDTGLCTNGICQASPLGGTCVSGADCTSGTCAGGICVCQAGTTSCKGQCVPTASFQSDPNNCGTCGTVCTTPANGVSTCTNGTCGSTCLPGFKLCNGACIPQGNCCTPADCPTPPNATATCANGTCGFTCLSGYSNCDGNPANGCETNQQTDVANCGACGNRCPQPANSTATCTNGTCAFGCNAGYVLSNGQCVRLPPPPPPDTGTTSFAATRNARPPGAPCTYDLECYSGECLHKICT